MKFIQGAKLYSDPATGLSRAQLSWYLPHSTFLSRDGTHFYQVRQQGIYTYDGRARFGDRWYEWRFFKGEDNFPIEIEYNSKDHMYSATGALLQGGSLAGQFKEVSPDALAEGIFHFLSGYSDPELRELFAALEKHGVTKEGSVRPMNTAREGIALVNLMMEHLPKDWTFCEAFQFIQFRQWEESQDFEKLLNYDLCYVRHTLETEGLDIPGSFYERIENYLVGASWAAKKEKLDELASIELIRAYYESIRFMPVWRVVIAHYLANDWIGRFKAPIGAGSNYKYTTVEYAQDTINKIDLYLSNFAQWLGVEVGDFETLTEQEYVSLAEKVCHPAEGSDLS